MSEHIVIFVTAPHGNDAARISWRLLDAKLVACANVIRGVRSAFWWEGKIDKADEVLIVMKTRREHLDAVMESVREVHTYEVPEIIALPIVGGNAEYLKWIDESVG